ncbi:uncharacterized protein PSFLO_01618 [Pseudozyma flocculosa]|uniref:Uncharacterized protein n=1 Tax=Pseudozyma flocculosa TaxID=84751 RepID=A0A5C3EXP3_9BASI|nr:uncharacterized protein PSFLO_01618 [Pseudozyma flocculosa]
MATSHTTLLSLLARWTDGMAGQRGRERLFAGRFGPAGVGLPGSSWLAGWLAGWLARVAAPEIGAGLGQAKASRVAAAVLEPAPAPLWPSGPCSAADQSLLALWGPSVVVAMVQGRARRGPRRFATLGDTLEAVRELGPPAPLPSGSPPRSVPPLPPSLPSSIWPAPARLSSNRAPLPILILPPSPSSSSSSSSSPPPPLT